MLFRSGAVIPPCGIQAIIPVELPTSPVIWGHRFFDAEGGAGTSFIGRNQAIAVGPHPVGHFITRNKRREVENDACVRYFPPNAECGAKKIKARATNTAKKNKTAYTSRPSALQVSDRENRNKKTVAMTTK